MWNFGLCKALINEFNIPKDDGALRSHLECLNALGRSVMVSAYDLYNKMTPLEYIVKVLGHTPKSHLRLAQKLSRGMQGILMREEDRWLSAAESKDNEIKAGKTWGEGSLLLIDLPVAKAKAKSKSSRKSSRTSANSKGSRKSFFKLLYDNFNNIS